MRKRETKATLQNAIESLEANLAEERANHDITRKERDGLNEKAESLETHLDAAYKDLKEAGDHLFFHHQHMRREAVLAKYRIEPLRYGRSDDMLDAFRYAMEGRRKSHASVITLKTSSTGGVFAAALGGALTGAVMTIAFVWAVIHFGL